MCLQSKSDWKETGEGIAVIERPKDVMTKQN